MPDINLRFISDSGEYGHQGSDWHACSMMPWIWRGSSRLFLAAGEAMRALPGEFPAWCADCDGR